MGLPFSITLQKIDVWRHSLVWVKDSLMMGRMDYHYRHEPIYYGWTPGAPHNAVPMRDQDTVWEFARPKRCLEHPMMKSVDLVKHAIQNSTRAGDLILDPFRGSGTTTIACEKAGVPHALSTIARVLRRDPAPVGGVYGPASASGEMI
jgi:site-specific DNA-methyltransferase (adenine-specific)